MCVKPFLTDILSTEYLTDPAFKTRESWLFISIL